MVREDFPGGFAGDIKNKFLESERSENENQAFNYISKLANFRKTSSALTRGALMQYIPFRGVYVYFRYDSTQTIICTVNTDTVLADISFRDYSERTKYFEMATDIMTGEDHSLSDNMSIPPRSIRILELKKRRPVNQIVR